MAKILCIESASTVCSAAIVEDGKVLSLHERNERNIHGSALTTFIENALADLEINYQDLAAIAVSKGPGSYTGLRIGVSLAKGFCFALDKPLIGISTLEAMAVAAIKQLNDADALYCPMIDARRMEVYAAIYDFNGTQVKPISADVIDESSYDNLLSEKKIYFFGDGALKCNNVLGLHKNASIVSDWYISAASMAPLAHKAWHNQNFENVAYFEPYYLKDFVAGKKKSDV